MHVRVVGSTLEDGDRSEDEPLTGEPSLPDFNPREVLKRESPVPQLAGTREFLTQRCVRRSLRRLVWISCGFVAALIFVSTSRWPAAKRLDMVHADDAVSRAEEKASLLPSTSPSHPMQDSDPKGIADVLLESTSPRAATPPVANDTEALISSALAAAQHKIMADLEAAQKEAKDARADADAARASLKAALAEPAKAPPFGTPPSGMSEIATLSRSDAGNKRVAAQVRKFWESKAHVWRDRGQPSSSSRAYYNAAVDEAARLFLAQWREPSGAAAVSSPPGPPKVAAYPPGPRGGFIVEQRDAKYTSDDGFSVEQSNQAWGHVQPAAPPTLRLCQRSLWVRRFPLEALARIERHALGLFAHAWDLYTLTRDAETVPGHMNFAAWEPVGTPEQACPPEVGGGLARIGERDAGDAGKSVCGLDLLKAEADCVVLSLGSRNEFGFENAILQKARNCKVHVFDCTVRAPHVPDNRIIYHSECIGGQRLQGQSLPNNFRTLASITKELGVERVALLKMDIEGAERAVFQQMGREWWATGGDVSWLPDQILLEVHCCTSGNADLNPSGTGKNMDDAELLYLLRAFTEVGYRVLSKERNQYGKAVEVTLLRFLC